MSTPATTTLRDGLKPCREFAYRNTEMGALTLTIVYDPVLKTIIKPSKVELSRSGRHGHHIYCLPDWGEVWVIRLEITNTEKRSVVFSRNVPQDIAQKVTAQWLAGATIDAIIKTLRNA